MIFCNKKFYLNFKKKNLFSLVYAVEKKAKISKINKLIDNVLLKKNSFIFESVEKAIIRGRYTIFGFNPDLTLNISGNKISLNKKIIKNKNPYFFLKKFIKSFNFYLPKHLPPMSAMLAGYFGYDIIRYIEKIPNKNKDDLNIPDIRLTRPNNIIIHDNFKNEIIYIKINYKKNTDYFDEISELKKNINEINNLKNPKLQNIKNIKFKIKSNISKKKFMDNVRAAKKYISIGDIFQVVLSQRFQAPLKKKTYRYL